MTAISKKSILVLFKALLLVTLFIGVSCTSESISDLDSANKKTNQKERPMKGNFSNTPVEGLDPFICLPDVLGIPLTTNHLFGNVTHLGKLQDGSLGEPFECEIVNDNPFTLKVMYNTKYVTPNGDVLIGLSKTFVIPDTDLDDPDRSFGTFTGTVKIVGGTGRFADAEGSWDFVNASYEGPNSTWQIDGSITY